MTSASPPRLPVALLVVLLAACQPADDRAPAPIHLGTTLSPIVGGTPDPGHPAVAAVVMSSFLCTGTLVSPKIVLTAAHCILPGDPIQEVGLGPKTSALAEILAVKKVVGHPEYGQQSVDGWTVNVHDIAIVVLEQAAKTPPMKYRTEPIDGLEGQSITFVGFGVTVPGNSTTTGTKMKVAAKIGKVFAQGFFNYTTAASPKNTCTGDSGGPAVLAGPSGDEVLSVVSGGDEGCVENGFNTRVDIHAAWIQGMIAQYDPGSAPGPACGNGQCESGESEATCPADCSGAGNCGNVSFEGCCNGELLEWCSSGQLMQADCQKEPKCGWSAGSSFYDCGTDGGEDPAGQHPKECTGAIGPACGDGTCDPTETWQTCPKDCAAADDCGGVTFQGCCDGEVLVWCEDEKLKKADCGGAGKPLCGWNEASGYYDCGTDGEVDPSGAHPKGCEAASTCGDGACDSPETAQSCPSDCAAGPACGDGVCEGGETSLACPADCGPKPLCGNGKCEAPETAGSCPHDCAGAAPGCGDGACSGGETPATCPEDCSWPSGPGADAGTCAGDACGASPKAPDAGAARGGGGGGCTSTPTGTASWPGAFLVLFLPLVLRGRRACPPVR